MGTKRRRPDGEDKASTCLLARFREERHARLALLLCLPVRLGFLGLPLGGPWRADQPRPVPCGSALHSCTLQQLALTALFCRQISCLLNKI